MTKRLLSKGFETIHKVTATIADSGLSHGGPALLKTVMMLESISALPASTGTSDHLTSPMFKPSARSHLASRRVPVTLESPSGNRTLRRSHLRNCTPFPATSSVRKTSRVETTVCHAETEKLPRGNQPSSYWSPSPTAQKRLAAQGHHRIWGFHIPESNDLETYSKSTPQASDGLGRESVRLWVNIRSGAIDFKSSNIAFTLEPSNGMNPS